MSRQIAIKMPGELYERLTALTRQTGRTASYYLREALERHLDDIEDLYLAEQRLADIRAGRSELIPLEEVISRLGLDDN